jgi:O-antigen ligase/polysaccharide polymerase Wzy-like membrane protein
MEHPDLAQVAALGGALGSVLALAVRGRLALLGGLGLLLLAELGLAVSLGGGPAGKLGSASGAAAAVIGLAVLAGAATVLVRRPALVPVLVLAAAPLRPPIEYDSSSTLLVSVATNGALGRLLPLYFVLLAAVAALAWTTLRGSRPRALPHVVALPAAAFFALAFLSLLWADDLEAGANLLAFFTLPFATLLAVVARAAYPPWVRRALAWVAIGLGVLFAGIGLWQAATHKLFFFAPNLEVSNANTDYFRVTSLFGDPSLYGRHVVLAIGVVLVLLATRRLDPRLGLPLLALLWAGLLFSYSQSSMVALMVVALAIALATGDRTVRMAVAAVAVVALLAVAGYGAAKLISGGSLNRLTSDRTARVQETTRVIVHHPLAGVGIGGQPRESRALAKSDRPTPDFVSHTTPLTVAAELGVVGAALYLWLLVGGARLLASVARVDRTLGLALGASFLALFVHALSYSGFLEDPITWVVLGVGAGFLSWSREEARAAPSAPEATMAT